MEQFSSLEADYRSSYGTVLIIARAATARSCPSFMDNTVLFDPMCSVKLLEILWIASAIRFTFGKLVNEVYQRA